MATLTAQNLIDRVKIILQDTTSVRWAESELLTWLNDGQREVVLLKPDAYVKNQSLLLVSGTKQAIPSDGVMVVDVVRNMSTNGTTAGASIRIVSREILDSQVSSWHVDTASTTVKHYVFDPRDPKRFYVYPKSDGTNYVELIYSAAPADILIAATLTLDDIYANALIDYICYRAYLKDVTFAGNDARAAARYQAFVGALGVKSSQQVVNNPNMSQLPFNPNVPGAAK